MRGGRRVLSVGAVLVALMSGGTLAHASGPIHIQALIEPSGLGRLFANNGRGPWRWEACSPDLASCESVGDGREVRAIGRPPGSVFRVKTGAGMGLSPEWRGSLRKLKPPGVTGTVEVNGYVSPIPAEWRGGWAGEDSQMQLAACLDPSGASCVSLTDPHFVRSCGKSASFAIESRFAGYFLRVADRRAGVGPALEPPYAVSSPNGGEVWRQSRNTAVGYVGKIEPSSEASPGECGPAANPTASISSSGAAQVECQGGCQAILLASNGPHRATAVETLPEESPLLLSPPSELRIARSAFPRLMPGPIRLVVELDGAVFAQRTIRAPFE